jgi:hypothetical protein
MAARGIPDPPEPVVGQSGTDRPLSGLRRAAMVGVNGSAAATAIGGGLALAAGWEADRFPRSWLSDTPFDTYLVPGVLLTGVVGGSAAVATLATLRGAPSAPRLSVLAGTIMIGWIGAEVIVLPAPARSWTELFYLVTGLAMCALGAAEPGDGLRGSRAGSRRLGSRSTVVPRSHPELHCRVPSVTRSRDAKR